MLANELASLRAAADFLEEQGMSQCELLRNAVKVLEFINGGGQITIERGLLGLRPSVGEEVEFGKGRAQRYWAPPVIDLDRLAKQIDEFEVEYNRQRETRGELMGFPIREVSIIGPGQVSGPGEIQLSSMSEWSAARRWPPRPTNTAEENH